jgi:hypothetical protein
MLDDLKRVGLGVLLALLAGCGGVDGAGGNPAGPAPQPEAPSGDSLSLAGVAAIGAALDGATVTVRGPDGQLIDLGDIVTGANGSYQVDLPADTPLPLLVIVQPPDGDPVRTVIPAAEDGATSIVANVNPMTELVTNEVIGAANDDPASVATSLGPVADDPAVIDATGDDVVQALFGNDVTYGSFADDPAFTAAGGDDLPTVADTLLDTLADTAADDGKTLGTFLAEQRALPTAPKLLEKPAFQVKLVGQLLAKGNAAEDIESTLQASGALAPLPDGETTDVFRAAIQAVPEVIAQANAATTSLDGSPDLKAAAAKAAVDTLANLVTERSERFGDSPASVATALASNGLRSAVASVVTNVVTPVLEQVAARDDGGSGVVNAVDSVLRTTAKAAGKTLSAFSTSQIEATNVSALATAHLQRNVVDANLADQLDAIQSGDATTTDLVVADDDVSKTTDALRDLVTGDPGLIDGGDADAVLDDPPGAWNVNDWNEFDWS